MRYHRLPLLLVPATAPAPAPPDENRGFAVVARAGVAFAATDDADDADDAADDNDDLTDDIAEGADVVDTLASASICSVDISSRMRRESSNRKSSCSRRSSHMDV